MTNQSTIDKLIEMRLTTIALGSDSNASNIVST